MHIGDWRTTDGLMAVSRNPKALVVHQWPPLDRWLQIVYALHNYLLYVLIHSPPLSWGVDEAMQECLVTAGDFGEHRVSLDRER